MIAVHIFSPEWDDEPLEARLALVGAKGRTGPLAVAIAPPTLESVVVGVFEAIVLEPTVALFIESKDVLVALLPNKRVLLTGTVLPESVVLSEEEDVVALGDCALEFPDVEVAVKFVGVVVLVVLAGVAEVVEFEEDALDAGVDEAVVPFVFIESE